ncbi:hypothetical protein, partial [Myxococcus eversor]|uniref:hypothetical protein n=1 Tax=Myxococcus eversor TaxID=2709661 RepID=UPI0019685E15
PGVAAGTPARVKLVLLHLGYHARQLHHLVDPRGRRLIQPEQWCCEASWLMDEQSAWLMGITERERERARSEMGAAY